MIAQPSCQGTSSAVLGEVRMRACLIVSPVVQGVWPGWYNVGQHLLHMGCGGTGWRRDMDSPERPWSSGPLVSSVEWGAREGELRGEPKKHLGRF